MAHAQLPVIDRSRVLTMRRDAWWVQPVVVFVLLGGFIVYATWAALQNAHYTFGPYLSPFYSPVIFGDTPQAWFGLKPAAWPAWLPFSPALLILPFPGLFRVTCYYYRGAYYKAFWADPPSCTVREPRSSYIGEHAFPLILQNIHRYFMYIALLFLVFLSRDVWQATQFTDPATGHTTFGIGVGTLVLALNVVLLSCYTFGCHSLRHVVGGYLDRLANRPVQRTVYACASCFNRWHMRWAWMSLFGVAFADIYVRMCSMGIWHDFRLI
jgi:hypothetical protein